MEFLIEPVVAHVHKRLSAPDFLRSAGTFQGLLAGQVAIDDRLCRLRLLEQPARVRLQFCRPAPALAGQRKDGALAGLGLLSQPAMKTLRKTMKGRGERNNTKLWMQ